MMFYNEIKVRFCGDQIRLLTIHTSLNASYKLEESLYSHSMCSQNFTMIKSVFLLLNACLISDLPH